MSLTAVICESPHDFPVRWAALFTAYIDESIEQDDGYVIIAGFLGRKPQWVRCARRWRKELGSRPALHMKSLRGWNDDRNKSLLERLGRVPNSCGLTLVYCSLKVSDYRDLVSETIVEVGNEGYILALRLLTVNILQSLPEGQRLELICEEQEIYAARRSITLSSLAKRPEFMDRHGFPRLAKWSAVPKTSFLEPSDYAAYAILQRLRDPSSRKAMLCAPILEQSRHFIGGHFDSEQVRDLMTRMRQEAPELFVPMTHEYKQYLKGELKVFSDSIRR